MMAGRKRLVFVGTYTEPIRFGTGQILQGQGRGIHIYRFDTDSGSLEPSGVAEGIRNPSYLAFHPSRRFLYCVNEMKEFEGAASGAVSAFALDPENGTLTFLNQVASHGTDPCHIELDATGAFALVSNFASGSVCVLPIKPDGSLGEASDVVQHRGSSVDPVRQKGPHAHSATPDRQGRSWFVPDLGLDLVVAYRLDTENGKLVPNETRWAASQPGAGPRGLVFSPSGAHAYLINELNSTVTAYRYQEAEGRLKELQTLSTLPGDFSGASSCAEMQISPSGKWLYASNRGHNSLAIFAVDPTDGTLAPIGHESTRGKIPRHFTVDSSGEWLLAANQDTNNIVVFRIDGGTGKLTEVSQTEAPTAVCVKIL